jgi:hypothetical protein
MSWIWFVLSLPFMVMGFVFELCATGFRAGRMLYEMTNHR